MYRLKYDPRTNSFEDNDEVKIKVPGFGGTSTVEYLSTGILSIKYFYTTVKYFVDRGYKRGETICAAPYDWRLAAGMFLSNYQFTTPTFN